MKKFILLLILASTPTFAAPGGPPVPPDPQPAPIPGPIDICLVVPWVCT